MPSRCSTRADNNCVDAKPSGEITSVSNFGQSFIAHSVVLVTCILCYVQIHDVSSLLERKSVFRGWIRLDIDLAKPHTFPTWQAHHLHLEWHHHVPLLSEQAINYSEYEDLLMVDIFLRVWAEFTEQRSCKHVELHGVAPE
eukprot:1507835-Amphidinium_carterae.1